MKYADNSFDVVVLGWVLAYSQNPKAAADEVIRVLKPGGVVAVGVEYHPLSVEQIKEQVGYVPGHTKRIESSEEILGFFENHVANLYFHHPIISPRKEVQGAMCVIFSIKK
jgi:ubiquinone/menaquinone biosynthesis C-methylase UbiE